MVGSRAMTRGEQRLDRIDRIDRIRPVLVCPTFRRVLSLLEYLDNVLIKHPAAHTIASGFAIEATKPGGAPAR